MPAHIFSKHKFSVTPLRIVSTKPGNIVSRESVKSFSYAVTRR